MKRRPVLILVAFLAVAACVVVTIRWTRESTPAPELEGIRSETGAERRIDPDVSLIKTGDSGSERAVVAAPTQPVVGTDGRVGELVVTVEDESQQRLESVEVFARRAGKWLSAGSTDTKGELVLGGDPLDRVCALHPDYCAGEREVSQGDSEITLVLGPGGVIEGRVLAPSLPPEVSVLVTLPVTEGGIYGFDIYWEGLTGHPVLGAWPVKPDGSFRIFGLDPALSWTVTAACRSFLSLPQTTSPGSPSSPAWVELPLMKLWGMELAFTGPGGAPLHHSPKLSSRECEPDEDFGIQIPAGYQMGTAYSWHASCYTIPPDKGVEHVDDTFFFRCCYYNENSAEAPPSDWPFACKLTGYKELEGRFKLEDPLLGFTTQTFELQPEVDGWGSLEIDILGVEYLRGVPSSKMEPPKFQFVLSNEQRRLVYQYSFPLPEKLVIGDVPYGEYDVHFQSTNRLVRLELTPQRLLIGPRPARAAVDMIETGSIRFHYPVEAGRRPPPLLQLSLIRGDGDKQGRSDDFFQPGPPFMVHHLPTGLYYIWLWSPVKGVHRDASASVPDTVVVGENSIVDVVLNIVSGPDTESNDE